LLDEQFRDFVELGPLAKLTSAITQTARAAQLDVTAMPTHARDDHELRTLAIALGRLHCRGAHVRWSRFYHGDATSVRLPTYPWQRERCWIDAPVATTPDAVPATTITHSPGAQQPESAPVAGSEARSTGMAVANERHDASVVPGNTVRSAPESAPSDVVTAEVAAADLRGLPQPDRQSALQTYLGRQIAQTLDVEPSAIGLREPLTHLGIDSLMAIEVKNRIESELRVKISIGQFLEGPTIAGLTDMLLPQLDNPPQETAEGDSVATSEKGDQPELAKMTRSEIETLLAHVDQLSDEQIDALLLQAEQGKGVDQ
jgi:acyl transferase domain-containing protein